MTRINKEIRRHFENYNQASFILATQLEKKEDLEERIQFAQKMIEYESYYRLVWSEPPLYERGQSR
jgi:hypothetical protein